MGGLSVSLRGYARFARLYLNEGSYQGQQTLTKSWIMDSMDVRVKYSRPGANQDAYNAIRYGYHWRVPDGMLMQGGCDSLPTGISICTM